MEKGGGVRGWSYGFAWGESLWIYTKEQHLAR